MALVQLTDVSLAFGARHVLEAASFALQEGETVGLIGVNGSGKTSLLRIIAGAAAADAGRVERRKGLRTGFMEQEPDLRAEMSVHEAALSAFSDLVEMEQRMRDLERAIAEAEGNRRKELLRQLGALQGRFEHAGGYERENRIAAVLAGLGFGAEEFTRPVSVLSGGERTRLALGRLLLRDADLLLLDEPTNHLDLAGIEWLEDFLQKKYRGAALIVPHDRLFLDRTVRRILDLEAGRVTEYPGNYSQYAELKEAWRLEQQKRYDEQREFIEKEEDFIRRYHYAQRSREARGRQKRLDRLERITAPARQKKISVRFDPRRESGETCVRTENLSKGFGERTLFRALDLEISRGERVGIIGPNGSGKTTLLKMLLGLEPPGGGTVQIGQHVQFGLLEQEPSGLSSERTVLEEVWQRDRKQDEVDVRRVLGRFLFTGDEAVGKRLCDLSGGERTRVALACLMVDRPNVLVLDEPTNHLDIPSRVALESALEDYGGTVIAVSHDRYFINQLVRKLLVLDSAGGRPELIHGNYETYEQRRQQASASLAAASAAPRPPKPGPATSSQPGQPEEKAGGRARLSKNRLARLEADISRLETEKTSLEADLARPDLYSNPVRARETPKRYEFVCRELEALYKQWTENAAL